MPSPEGRCYVGCTIRPQTLAHFNRVADLSGYRSSSDFLRAAIAAFAAAQQLQETDPDPALAESLAALASISENIRSRRAIRQVQAEVAAPAAGGR